LTEALLKSFQRELVKRVLKLPNHSNTAAFTALNVSTMKGRILVRKPGFMKSVMDRGTDCLSGSVLLVLCNDVDSFCLVRECKELEGSFKKCFTEMITNNEGCSLMEMKKIILNVNIRILLERCAGKAPIIAKMARHPK